MKAPFSSIIRGDVKLGKNVRFTGFVNLYGCTIGDETIVGPFVEIQKDATVGARVKIGSHSFICSGVTIEDESIISHGVMFTNDRYPRATTDEGKVKGHEDWSCEKTWVGKRAGIGSNATILCGIKIGENAMVGAGSVVTKDVPANAVVAGNPAKVIRYLDAIPTQT